MTTYLHDIEELAIGAEGMRHDAAITHLVAIERIVSAALPWTIGRIVGSMIPDLAARLKFLEQQLRSLESEQMLILAELNKRRTEDGA